MTVVSEEKRMDEEDAFSKIQMKDFLSKPASVPVLVPFFRPWNTFAWELVRR